MQSVSANVQNFLLSMTQAQAQAQMPLVSI